MKDKILNFLKKIPKSKVVSYKQIADKFWIHPRAVAMIMKHNKYPDIYPCYKVVSASGKISGYSAKDWVQWKIEKLKKDWIVLTNWKIDEKYFYYF